VLNTLDRPTYTAVERALSTPSFETVLPPTITGQDIARCRRTPQQRAAIGAQLRLGECILVRPTERQVTQITEANRTYVRLAEKITSAERNLVAAGDLDLRAVLPVDIDRWQLVDLAHQLGADRWIEIAAEAGL
jgi:hypothetical protein